VLLYAYGGPGAQVVKDRWRAARGLWEQYLGQKGIVLVSVDNRGTGGGGEAFKGQVCRYTTWHLSQRLAEFFERNM
jgi:dipeptidyl aminopeptidase/acylaminoacyl peptidase